MHQKIRKGLASLLTAVMLVSALPVTAWADESGGAVPDPAVSEETAGPETAGPETAEPETAGPETVEPDADWALSEIGFLVGGQYVQAIEEDGGIATMSLLPLEEKRYNLDLTGFFPEELKETQISYVLENLTGSQTEDVTASDVAVWARWSYYDENEDHVYDNDRYTLVNDSSTLDLSDFYYYYSDNSKSKTSYLELIVGKPDQLESSNRRYIITATVTSGQLDVAAKGGVVLTDWYATRQIAEKERYHTIRLQVDPDTWNGSDPFAVTMSLNSDYTKHGAVSAAIYEGYHTTAAEAERSTDITAQLYGISAPGYSADFSEKELLKRPAVTAVFQRDGKVVGVTPFYLQAYLASDNVSLSYYIRTKETETYFRSVGSVDYNDNVTDENGVRMTVYGLYSTDSSVNSDYYVSADFSHYGDYVPLEQIGDYVAHTALGYYSTAAGAQAQPDITQQLFDNDSGYRANYSVKGQVFTVVMKKDNSLQYLGAVVKAREESSEPSSQTYFRANGAYQTQDSRSYQSYTVDTDNDSYAGQYQTVFLMDRASYRDPMTPVAADTIYPTFSAHSKAHVVAVATANGKDLGAQLSGQSAVPFASGETIEYTVYSEDKSAHNNYFVTFITQQEGAKLYVNAQSNIDLDTNEPYRTIHIDEADDYHDILFANIGDEELTGLYVKLEGADSLQLDPYWNIGTDSTGKLAPFTTTDTRTPGGSYTSYGELPNLGKIRLIPKVDENGEIVSGLVNGYLTIGSANGGEVKMKLTGTTGRLAITNTDLVEGVQYVPYSSGIRTNCINANNTLRYTLTEDSDPLPSPLFLNEDTGEIYGVPKVSGAFKIKVRVQYKGLPEGLPEETLARMSAEAEYTLTILANGDDNVWNATDEDYDVTKAIGTHTTGNHYVWSSGDDVFTSKGDLGQFLALYLDGDRLTPDVDYSAVSGSTVITVRAQTLSSKGSGTHTLAAEFRDSNGDLRKAAQNYEVKVSSSTSTGSSTRPSSNKKPSSSSKPSTTTPSTPQTTPSTPSTPATPSTPNTPSTGLPFVDVPAGSWFLEDVRWIYEQELMNGTSETNFTPDTPISQAVIVTVLARMAKVDLTQFAGMTDDSIQPGQWYTNAALWAKQAGLLPNAAVFTGEEPISREQMAIMLVKYLRSTGRDTNPPAQPVAFADAALMSQAGNSAFQVLYQYNIFKGVGNNCMDPSGSTTRAQFAALVHRLSDTGK